MRRRVLAVFTVAARAALRDVLPTFKPRYEKLREVVARIRAQATECDACPAPGAVRFDPPEPTGSLVHVYLACSVEDAMAIMDKVETRIGIRVLSRFRSVPEFKRGLLPASVSDLVTGPVCYCEWNMGVHNVGIRTEEFVRGWSAVCEELAVLPRTCGSSAAESARS